MKRCEKCGRDYDSKFAFCPECGIALVNRPQVCSVCGAALREGTLFCTTCGAKAGSDEKPATPEPRVQKEPEAERVAAMNPAVPGSAGLDPALFVPSKNPQAPNAGVQQAPYAGIPQAPNVGASQAPSPSNRKSTSIKAIIGIVAVAVVLFSLWGYKAYTAPRELKINSGLDIETYVGGYEFIYADGPGLTGLEEVEWTVDDSKLIKIEGSSLEAFYDKDAFYASSLGLDSDDEASYTTYIYGTVKKGLRTWTGSAKVIVSLQEEIHANGQIYIEPAGATDSYLEVTASDDRSTYFHLKSQTNPKNDISFIIDKGRSATIYVPCDTYLIFMAHGQTWYGPDILFGPNTVYTKNPEEMEFTDEVSWSYRLGVVNGNSPAEDINPYDFPDSDEGSSSESV